MTVAQLDKNPAHIAKLFDGVANHYDFVNSLASMGQTRVWRMAARQAVNAGPGMKVLDVAAGTGESSIALARDGADVTAADISQGMIEVGRRKHPELTFVHADAMNLPFPDNHFDIVTISYGLRNMPDPEKALREFYRVTKPGGRLIMIEFSRPVFTPFRLLYEFYLKNVVPRVAWLSGNKEQDYIYLMESILQWPDQQRMAHILMRNGWDAVAYKNLTNGIVALHHAKKNA